MEIRLDDHLATTTMRTPGHDFELAVGFCHNEGLLGGAAVGGASDTAAPELAVDTEFNVVSVSTGGWAPEPTARIGTTSSSCGMCGSMAIEQMTAYLDPLERVEFDWGLLERVAESVTAQQELFVATGAAHAAAAFRLADGGVTVVREDIGRHNAVDKVTGRLLLDGGLPALAVGPSTLGLGVGSGELRDGPEGVGERVRGTCVGECARARLPSSWPRRAGSRLLASAVQGQPHRVRAPASSPMSELDLNGNPIERILVIVAHPDDVDYGSAAPSPRGPIRIEVTYCLVTSGDGRE